MNRNRVIALLVVAVFLMGALAVGALASDHHTERVRIGDSLTITGPSSASGVFSAAGGVNDSGSTRAVFRVASVRDNVATVVGEEDLTGAHGTIVLRFEVRSFPANEPRQIATGRTTVERGTGMYTGLKGLTLTDRTVVDFASSRVIDILDNGR